jgi:cytoskeletal protein RodZ
MNEDKDPFRSDAMNLAALQGERLREIGAYLNQVRHEQGITLDTIAQQTFIQAYQLRAIEAGEIHSLPEPVYIQGFIKKYAIALGLNGKDLAASFPVDRPT